MKMSKSGRRLLKARTIGSLLLALAISWTSVGKVAADEVLVPSSLVDVSDVLKLKSTPLPAKPKIGLALGGGGSRGAAEIGVLEVLQKEGIHFDCISGTSIGSIIGGLLDAGVPMTTLHEEFGSGRLMKHFMRVSLPTMIVLSPIVFGARLVRLKRYDGLYPGWAFRHYLEKMTPTGSDQIQNLKIPYAAVTFNLADGKPYMVRGGSLPMAMLSSSAVPGLREPVIFGDKVCVDGGTACNLPVKQCREMGADIVIAVNIDQPFSACGPNALKKIGSIPIRLLNWTLYSNDASQEQLADVVIHPDTGGVTLITTSKKEARIAIEAGRKAGEAALPAIRERLKGVGTLAGSQTFKGVEQASTASGSN
jgi:NTE family protein